VSHETSAAIAMGHHRIGRAGCVKAWLMGYVGGAP